MNDLESRLIEWRRDFHKHPELGFLEMRTSTIVAHELETLGFDLEIGREVMSPGHCLGKPDEAQTEAHADWARENGAVEKYMDRVSEGYTGIVATWDTGRPGPTVAYRVDMDALPIHEADDENHVPARSGFRSLNTEMHACGHDAHTSIGLGLAVRIAENQDQLNGRIKLIFQPAEEGARGAISMVEAGAVDDVDCFIATHIGIGVEQDHFVASNNGFLATSKMDVRFKGVSSHAGGRPEEGKNAMLAAANAVINLSAIPRHAGGMTRINVGTLHAGSGRNVIADEAVLTLETRGETSGLNDYMKTYAESVIEGAARMHQVDYEIELVGEGISAKGSTELAEILHECAKSNGLTSLVQSDAAAGSEDATFFMDAVQKQDGYATYCVIGTDLAAGHHNERFDVNEKSLLQGVETLYASAVKLTNQ